jgi:hypothetical protein
MSDQNNAQDQYTEFRETLDELERVQAGSDVEATATDAADPIKKFCQIWPTARGVLELILKLPFIPGAAKTVLRQFIQVANAICGG